MVRERDGFAVPARRSYSAATAAMPKAPGPEWLAITQPDLTHSISCAPWSRRIFSTSARMMGSGALPTVYVRFTRERSTHALDHGPATLLGCNELAVKHLDRGLDA